MKVILALIAFCTVNAQAACSTKPEENETLTDNSDNNQNNNSATMHIIVNDRNLKVSLADNAATRALKERLQNGSITYTSSSYGNFETVGNLGFSLPTSNTSITTQAGDVVLYQGNQICIFYGSNSWSYTQIGRITNASQSELRNLLSAGSISITLSLSADTTDASSIAISVDEKPSLPIKGIYSLEGRKLSEAPQKGTYIEDGVKKVR